MARASTWPLNLEGPETLKSSPIVGLTIREPPKGRFLAKSVRGPILAGLKTLDPKTLPVCGPDHQGAAQGASWPNRCVNLYYSLKTLDPKTLPRGWA